MITAMRYIERYIKPNDRVLEMGAATKRYSHMPARHGYKVDATELVEHDIEFSGEKHPRRRKHFNCLRKRYGFT